MKIVFVIITLLNFGNLFCQDLSCLSYKLYNSVNDVVQIKNELNLESEVSKTKSLQLIVFSSSRSKFPEWTSHKRNGVENGFKVILLNNSSNSFSLFNIDGNIIIKRQVYFENEWKNLVSYDKTLQSFCGNSLFTKKIIESGSHFTFIAPCISGHISVVFRFAVFTKPMSDQSPIYSNEFKGFINKNIIE